MRSSPLSLASLTRSLSLACLGLTNPPSLSLALHCLCTALKERLGRVSAALLPVATGGKKKEKGGGQALTLGSKWSGRRQDSINGPGGGAAEEQQQQPAAPVVKDLLPPPSATAAAAYPVTLPSSTALFETPEARRYRRLLFQLQTAVWGAGTGASTPSGDGGAAEPAALESGSAAGGLPTLLQLTDILTGAGGAGGVAPGPAGVDVTGPSTPVSLLISHSADPARRTVTLHCRALNRTIEEIKGVEVSLLRHRCLWQGIWVHWQQQHLFAAVGSSRGTASCRCCWRQEHCRCSSPACPPSLNFPMLICHFSSHLPSNSLWPLTSNSLRRTLSFTLRAGGADGRRATGSELPPSHGLQAGASATRGWHQLGDEPAGGGIWVAHRAGRAAAASQGALGGQQLLGSQGRWGQGGRGHAGPPCACRPCTFCHFTTSTQSCCANVPHLWPLIDASQLPSGDPAMRCRPYTISPLQLLAPPTHALSPAEFYQQWQSLPHRASLEGVAAGAAAAGLDGGAARVLQGIEGAAAAGLVCTHRSVAPAARTTFAALHGTSWEGEAVAVIVVAGPDVPATAAASDSSEGGAKPSLEAAAAPSPARLQFFFRSESAAMIGHMKGHQAELLDQLTGGLVIPAASGEGDGAAAEAAAAAAVPAEPPPRAVGTLSFLRGFVAREEEPAAGGDEGEAEEGGEGASGGAFDVEHAAVAEWVKLRVLQVA